MHNQLLKDIGAKYPISVLDIEVCQKYFEAATIPKNTIVEELGKVPKYLYYIVSGYMRLFYYDDQGDEITIHLNCPHGFFSSFAHFSNQTPSDVYVECITDCELLKISKPNYDNAMNESSVWKDFGLFVLQESMSYNEGRSKDLATLNAEQRYLKLMDTHPQIIQNVPLQYIASFLGMKSESLSRIRRKI